MNMGGIIGIIALVAGCIVPATDESAEVPDEAMDKVQQSYEGRILWEQLWDDLRGESGIGRPGNEVHRGPEMPYWPDHPFMATLIGGIGR